MHTPPGATRFTLEITPKKPLRPIWRNTARNRVHLGNVGLREK
jgi:hypothetical protein